MHFVVVADTFTFTYIHTNTHIYVCIKVLPYLCKHVCSICCCLIRSLVVLKASLSNQYNANAHIHAPALKCKVLTKATAQAINFICCLSNSSWWFLLLRRLNCLWEYPSHNIRSFGVAWVYKLHISGVQFAMTERCWPYDNIYLCLRAETLWEGYDENTGWIKRINYNSINNSLNKKRSK